MAEVNPLSRTASQPSLKRRITYPLVTSDVIEKLYTLFRSDDDSNKISLDKLLQAVEREGLRLTDPRLQTFMERKKRLKTSAVDEATLERLLGLEIHLISTAIKQLLVIPDFQAFCQNVEIIFNQCKINKDGKVATYIPELAKVNFNYWGCSVCTVDGQRFSLGDATESFTLQSVSKPLAYAYALKKLGADKVHEYVGFEPSGLIFNALVLDGQQKPHNPMINPGAIIISALLENYAFPDMTVDGILSEVMQFFKKMAGTENVGYNDTVYMSEQSTGFRNRAIAYLMKEKDWFPKVTVDNVLELYYKLCSVEVNCESLSVIAATLANGGLCPLTNEVVFKHDVVRCVLSVMQSCGMYDYSGKFAFEIGLPAKSGVSGGIMFVVPSVMGVALWSPPLDECGNSVKGLQFCKKLLKYYCLHPYSYLGHADPDEEDLTKRPARQKDENVMRILFAASRGDTEALHSYFLRNLDMAVTDYDGRSALHLAAAEGHLDCARFLVEMCKVPINPRDRLGRTPRQDAEDFCQFDVANFLKCIGASL